MLMQLQCSMLFRKLQWLALSLHNLLQPSHQQGLQQLVYMRARAYMVYNPIHLTMKIVWCFEQFCLRGIRMCAVRCPCWIYGNLIDCAVNVPHCCEHFALDCLHDRAARTSKASHHTASRPPPGQMRVPCLWRAFCIRGACWAMSHLA